MKTKRSQPSELALLGAEPSFKKPVHVNLPTVPDRRVLNKLIDDIWKTHGFSNNGTLVKELETKLASYLGVKHCILVSNGTLGLQILIRGMGLTGEVILPAFTFIATANAVRWEGLTPVFCDVEPGTPNLSVQHCKKLITAKTSAILGVHVWGQQCDDEALQQIACDHSLSIIYDAAHAFGCIGPAGRLIGSYGDAEVFSFHATKAFHTAEGGAITTNNDDLAEHLKQIRNFGFVDTDKTTCLGINAKMSELHAAVGLVNHSEFPENVRKSQLAYSTYSRRLREIEDLELIEYNSPHNFHYVVAFVQDTSLLCRDQLIQILEAENILARRYFYPGCHQMAPYIATGTQLPLPETEKLAASTLVLPAGPEISLQDVEKICDVLVIAFKNKNLLSHADLYN